MSIVPYKKMKTDQGEASTQDESNSEWTEAMTKRKRHKKHSNTSTVLHATNLLDLNDDCLYEIFKRVSVMDLALIARTSTKLKEIATDIFVRSHKICDFESMALDAATVARLLNTFGSSISELRICFTPYEMDAVKILDSILRDCTELKSLTMKSYDIPDCQGEFKKIRQLFGKLHSLHIVDVLVEDWESWMGLDDCSYIRTVTPNGNVMNLFGDCHSLVDLKIVDCCVLERAIFDQKFPKLEHFHYMDSCEHLVKGVRAFVFRHSDLKTLRLGDNIKITDAIQVIAANCTKLEELHFETEGVPEPGWWYKANYETSLRQLGKLQNLTKLKICWYGQNVIELLNEFRQSTSTSLKVLELDSTLGSWDLIPIIGQIKTLRVLKLYCIDHLQNLTALRDLTQLVELFIKNLNLREFAFDLVDIIQRLADLKKFKFDVSGYRNSYRISKNIYLQLVKIVENRPVVKNRYLELDCRTTQDFEELLRPSVAFKPIN